MPFDPNFALRLAEFADDAYKSIWSDHDLYVGYGSLDGSWRQYYSLARWFEVHGYLPIEDPHGITRDRRNWGIVGTLDDDAVVVAFRGTAGVDDLAIDGLGGGTISDSATRISYPFDVWNIGQHTVWAHKMFLGVYNGVRDSIRKTIANLFADGRRTKLYITGHSLGAALATLCAIDLGLARANNKRIPAPRSWTFASPYVGDKRLAALANQQTLESYRINNPKDWVTTIPSRGWTPDWQKWFEGGGHGVEPQRFALYVHVGDSFSTPPIAAFIEAHRMKTYYSGCKQMVVLHGNPQLAPNDAVTSLVVRIKTRDSLGAGTDNDVSVVIGGTTWGPLDTPDNDFEAGSIGEYDLFRMFPDRKPLNLRVSDLNLLQLWLGHGPFYVSNFSMGWEPEWAEIVANGIVLTRARYVAELNQAIRYVESKIIF